MFNKKYLKQKHKSRHANQYQINKVNLHIDLFNTPDITI